MPAKYYVVWKGHETGVFSSWGACQRATAGYTGARFKSFKTLAMAQRAFEEGAESHWGKAVPGPAMTPQQLQQAGKPQLNSIAVDAACNMRTGVLEYQGVYTENRQRLFHQGPYPGGSNNIGEFLAIVHALAWCKKHHVDIPIYTDSQTALAWVRKKNANTKVVPSHENSMLFELMERAGQWLKQHTWKNQILKWNTEAWGEIPADFGRK